MKWINAMLVGAVFGGVAMIALLIVSATQNHGDPGVMIIPTGDGTMVVIPTTNPQ